jgi:hypothetical protein
MSNDAESVPEKPVTPTELGRHWGTSRAHGGQQIKKGCPTKPFGTCAGGDKPENPCPACVWRKEKSVYGVGYRRKQEPLHKDAYRSTESLQAEAAVRASTRDAGKRPERPRGGNTLPEPDHPYLQSLWQSLDNAIRMEQKAFDSADEDTKPVEAKVRAYNQARDGRFAAEKAYSEALERVRALVPLAEAKEIGSRGYLLMLPELQALGLKIAEDSSDDAETRLRIKCKTDELVQRIIRKAQGAFADAA